MKNKNFFALVRCVLCYGAIATFLLLMACTPAPKKGTVTIKTRIDFNVWPRGGNFEVPEGADTLGCSAGSFVDTPVEPNVQKLLTCESGTRSGTFTAEFSPKEVPGPGDENGPWHFVAATGDFTGLAGGGDFWVVVDEGTASGVEALTGEIEYGA